MQGPPLSTQKGKQKCGQGSTTCWLFTLPPTTTVIGQVTVYLHTIKDSVTCESSNCMYYRKCVKNNCNEFPKWEYVGFTRRPYRISEAYKNIKISDCLRFTLNKCPFFSMNQHLKPHWLERNGRCQILNQNMVRKLVEWHVQLYKNS